LRHRSGRPRRGKAARRRVRVEKLAGMILKLLQDAEERRLADEAVVKAQRAKLVQEIANMPEGTREVAARRLLEEIGVEIPPEPDPGPLSTGQYL